MQQQQYEHYLNAFNNQDYETVLSYYVDEPEIYFAGYTLQGKQEILDFYAFFHHYVRESITFTRYVSDATTVVLEADVRIEGIMDLGVEILKEKGFERLIPLNKGDAFIVPQFIHYHLNANGKFTHALCAVVDAPRVD